MGSLRHWALVLLCMGSASIHAQSKDTLKFMFQNLLNYPIGGGGIPAREDTLAKIVQYELPDLMMVCELSNAAGNPPGTLLTNAFNINGITHYQHAPFVLNTSSGDNLQQLIFYNTDKLVLKRQSQLPTNLRDINKYVMYYKDPNLSVHHDTTWVDVYVTHLKASTGGTNETMRDQEITVLRNHLNTNPTLRNSIFAADMNVYTSAEPCYQTITTTGTYPLQDPIAQPGAWNNNAAFKNIHTQCTRSTTLGGDGASGGLDDRFDQILVSSNIISGANRLRYIPGTYHAVGQDGFHFNNSVNATPANTAVPATIASALYYMSDHLPVAMDIEFTYPLVLPVALLEFEATNLGNAVQVTGHMEQLTQETVSLQHAGPDGQFQTLVPIHPDFNGNFRHTDHPGPGLHQYRLQFEDANGTRAYSHTVSAWTQGNYNWQALPSPDHITIHLPSASPFSGSITITDLNGKQLLQQAWSAADYQTRLEIPTPISQGMYLVTLTDTQSGWQATKKCLLTPH